jgi:hypothetical protein
MRLGSRSQRQKEHRANEEAIKKLDHFLDLIKK